MNSRITRPNASSIRSAVSITDEIETIYDEITRRAYELFLAHRGEGALDVEDWLLAERELLIKPPASVYRSGNRIKVTVGLGGVQPVHDARPREQRRVDAARVLVEAAR